MEQNLVKNYKNQIQEGLRCRDWMNLESTQEFLQPLKEKLLNLQHPDVSKLLDLDDRTFRSKIESQQLAYEEIKDFFDILDVKIGGIKSAEDALKGKDIEDYS